MTNITLNIVSHSHWDREWYMSHAKHNYRLIKLMDTLIDTLENDDKFNSFHLDGQVVILEDYLKIRPQNEERLKKLIATNRIKIGPFYVLQDEFLISGEENIRNLLYGLKVAKKYGKPTMIGYFPDTFGSVSQLPQIMQGFNIDNAFFGRGIIQVGSDNEVLEKTEKSYSEIIWQGADGSEIIGVQFAYWYHNAYQLPSDRIDAKERLDKIVKLTSSVAKTPELLGMNGCDHQPVQTDLSSVISNVKNIVDYKIIHTTLEDYLFKIKPYKDSFYKYYGEITGQDGSGYNNLINTASSCIDIKQMSYRCQHLLENLLEPISVMYRNYGGIYDADMIEFCYKKMLENFAHDSICCCGVDEVKNDMRQRFNFVYDTATSLLADVKKHFAEKLYTKEDKNIIVFNTDIVNKTDVVKIDVLYKNDEQLPTNLALIDEHGAIIPAKFSEITKEQYYELPDDKFRIVGEAKKISVEFLATNVPATSYKTFSIVDRITERKTYFNNNVNCIENSLVKIVFNTNGSFNIIDKKTNKMQKNLNYFEDIGDCGDEYNFIPNGETVNTLKNIAKINIYTQNAIKTTVKIETQLNNTAITSFVSVFAHSAIVKIKTKINNSEKNHRIRANFENDIETDCVYSEGQFDLVERKINTTSKWKNPSNTQRMTNFAFIKDSKNNGICIGSKGLNEYEVSRDGKNTFSLTLLRAIGEMGDWFYFPTPQAQMQGELEVEYCVSLFDGESYKNTINDNFDFARPKLLSVVTGRHNGFTEKTSVLKMETNGAIVQLSALKLAEDDTSIICRISNYDNSSQNIAFNKNVVLTNLNEERLDNTQFNNIEIMPKKILTFKVV